jgi:uncharacterized protein YjbI with pentapeptide repeats
VFDLELDWGELAGETKSAKCHACIAALARRGRLGDLLSLLREERPSVGWPEIPSPEQQIVDERSLATSRDPEAFYRDLLSTISQLRARGLTNAAEHAEARQIASTHTREVLRELDGALKGRALCFLYDAGLIGQPHPFYAGEAIISLEGAPLEAADLHGAMLACVDLSRTDLRGADLSHTDLSDAYLAGARLGSANIGEATLSGAILRTADLQDAVLRDADLRGAVLTDADLRGCDLRGASYDRTTAWPESFDPVAAGALLCGEAAPHAPRAHRRGGASDRA